jgi:ATP-dependent protease ClpP protease subunit
MSLNRKKLPNLKALSIEGAQWDAPSDALQRWSPEVHAAKTEDNTITMYDVIGSDGMGGGITVKRIAAALRQIGNQDVSVSINSPGGDFFEGISIYNLLRDHPKKVEIKVVGLAASAASVVAMAGDEIRIAEAGFLMIHNSWALVIGNQDDLRDEVYVM